MTSISAATSANPPFLHFFLKSATKGSFHFFVSIDKNLFINMKKKVLEILEVDDQDLFWHDDTNYVSLNSPTDMEAALDFAIKKSTIIGGAPILALYFTPEGSATRKNEKELQAFIVSEIRKNVLEQCKALLLLNHTPNQTAERMQEESMDNKKFLWEITQLAINFFSAGPIEMTNQQPQRLFTDKPTVAKEKSDEEIDMAIREDALNYNKAGLARRESELKEEQEIFNCRFKMRSRELSKKEDDLAKREAELESRQRDLKAMQPAVNASPQLTPEEDEELPFGEGEIFEVEAFARVNREVAIRALTAAEGHCWVAQKILNNELLARAEARYAAMFSAAKQCEKLPQNFGSAPSEATPALAVDDTPTLSTILAQLEQLKKTKIENALALDRLLNRDEQRLKETLSMEEDLQKKISAAPAPAVEEAPEPALDERRIARVMIEAGVNRGDAIRALRAAEGDSYFAEKFAKKDKEARIEKRFAELPRTDTTWVDEKSEEWKAAERLIYGCVLAEEDERREKDERERAEAAKVDAAKESEKKNEELPRMQQFSQQHYNAGFAAGAQYQAGLQAALQGAPAPTGGFTDEYQAGYNTGRQQLEKMEQMEHQMKQERKEMAEKEKAEDDKAQAEKGEVVENTMDHEKDNELSSDDSFENIDHPLR